MHAASVFRICTICSLLELFRGLLFPQRSAVSNVQCFSSLPRLCLWRHSALARHLLHCPFDRVFDESLLPCLSDLEFSWRWTGDLLYRTAKSVRPRHQLSTIKQ